MSDEERLVEEGFAEAKARLEEEYERITLELKARLEEIKRKYAEKLSEPSGGLAD